MDQYADFVEASLGQCDPVRVAWQKELEERIRTPFRMGADATAFSHKRSNGDVPGNHHNESV
jgi:hypothetical protein